MSDQQGNEAIVPEVVSGVEEIKQVLPGAMLAAQRQAKGWSVEHAASQLKFATRQVVALESDNYAALPGPVIVRGFVRAYAKLLGMDAGALVAALPQENAVASGERIVPQRTLSTPFSESPLPLGNRKNISPLVLGGVAAVAVVAVLAGIVLKTDLLDRVPQLAWLKHSSPAVPAPQDAADGAQPAAAEQAEPVQEVQADEEHGKPDADDANADNGAATAKAAAPAAPAAPAVAAPPAAAALAPAPVAAAAPVAPAAPVAQAVPAAAAVAAPAAAAGGNLTISQSKNLLRLNFREDSWVEIRRGDNSTMISRLLKAGTSEAFDISEPVTLVVGNAAGVDATLRGSKLDLQTNNSSNVARLSLK